MKQASALSHGVGTRACSSSNELSTTTAGVKRAGWSQPPPHRGGGMAMALGSDTTSAEHASDARGTLVTPTLLWFTSSSPWP